MHAFDLAVERGWCILAGQRLFFLDELLLALHEHGVVVACRLHLAFNRLEGAGTREIDVLFARIRREQRAIAPGKVFTLFDCQLLPLRLRSLRTNLLGSERRIGLLDGHALPVELDVAAVDRFGRHLVGVVNDAFVVDPLVRDGMGFARRGQHQRQREQQPRCGQHPFPVVGASCGARNVARADDARMRRMSIHGGHALVFRYGSRSAVAAINVLRIARGKPLPLLHTARGPSVAQ